MDCRIFPDLFELLKAALDSVGWMFQGLFNHFLTRGCLDCFRYLAVTNSAAVSTLCVNISVPLELYLPVVPRTGVALLRGKHELWLFGPLVKSLCETPTARVPVYYGAKPC